MRQTIQTVALLMSIAAVTACQTPQGKLADGFRPLGWQLENGTIEVLVRSFSAALPLATQLII